MFASAFSPPDDGARRAGPPSACPDCTRIRRDGLAFSSTSKYYAIKSVEEARAYLDHPILGPRLLECAEAVTRVEGRSAREIFGSPDDLKLRSCATLFARVSPPGSVFDRLLEKYYQGGRDDKTLRLLGNAPEIGNVTGGAGNE